MNATAVRKISQPSLRDRVSEEEWQVRTDLAAAYRLSHIYGWTTTLIYNHISARIPGPEHHFLLNPFGLRWDEVTASNLVKIDLEGNILDDTEYGINKAGYTIHSAIHRAREDAMCVIHTHTEAGIVVSSLEDGLIYTNQDAMMFYGHTAYHDFEGIALDLEERERLVADLGGNFAFILRNHGLLTTGTSVGEAWVRMYFLEKVCAAQVSLLSAAAAKGQAVRFPSKEVCERTARQYDESDMGPREWPALVRQLDAVCDDYRA